MKKEKNIKKEIEKHLCMILNLAGVKKSIADKVIPVGTERIMDDVVREAFERFIEETTLPIVKVKNEEEMDTVKELLAELDQTQQKWLEENL